jgi:Family of unknown function (DUF6356)
VTCRRLTASLSPDYIRVTAAAEMQRQETPGMDTISLHRALFLDHPRSLGETYWQHHRRALRFGVSMIAAGTACLVHALFPAVFVRTASTVVLRLHDEVQAAKRLSASHHSRSNQAAAELDHPLAPAP